MEKQQTAVEWLQQEVILQTNLPLNLENVLIFNMLIKKAEKIFEQQIISAYFQGTGSIDITAQEYYNETFKSE